MYYLHLMSISYKVAELHVAGVLTVNFAVNFAVTSLGSLHHTVKTHTREKQR